jgi:hypothetical protein
MIHAIDTSHRLTWGPRAGQSVQALATTDEGRGHLRWLIHHHDAPPEDPEAAREALKALRPAPQAMASPRSLGYYPGKTRRGTRH